MRTIAAVDPFLQLRELIGGVRAKCVAIVLALSLVVSFCGVHSALARADGPSAASVTLSVPTADADQPDASPGLAHFAHLAGHLTGVIEPAVVIGLAQDAVLAPSNISADRFPHSSALPTPSEPPRAEPPRG